MKAEVNHSFWVFSSRKGETEGTSLPIVPGALLSGGGRDPGDSGEASEPGLDQTDRATAPAVRSFDRMESFVLEGKVLAKFGLSPSICFCPLEKMTYFHQRHRFPLKSARENKHKHIPAIPADFERGISIEPTKVNPFAGDRTAQLCGFI